METIISVIIPCYNIEKYLNRCIESIVNQSLSNIEIILIDDGSKDDVPKICDKWAVIDERIKVIHKTNEGLGFARNSGLDIATGRYVAFIDGDDYIHKDMFRDLYKETNNGTIDIVRCGYYRQLNNGTYVVDNIYNDFYNENDIWDALCELIGARVGRADTEHRQSSVWCGIYKLSIIKDNNLRFHSEREVLCEDAVFHTELFKYAKTLKYVPKPYYYYCYNGKSLSHSFNPLKIDALDTLVLYEDKSYVAARCKQFQDRVLRQYAHLANCMHHQIMESNLSYSDKKKLCNKIYSNKRWSEIWCKYNMSNMPYFWRFRIFLFYRGCFRILHIKYKVIITLKKIIKR